MKLIYSVILILVVIGCGQKTSPETSNEASDSVMSATPAEQPKQEEQAPVIEENGPAKLQLTEANLIKFPFIGDEGDEFTFSDGGKFTFSKRIFGEANDGAWLFAGSSIQIVFGTDTALFEVQTFTEDELNLAAASPLAESWFGIVSNDGYFYARLSRQVYSPPYTEDQFTGGGWQAREGACGFDPSGNFTFGAADCNVEGEWKFDGKFIRTKLTKKDCGWPDPFDTKLELMRLTNRLMVVKNSQEGIEIYHR
ncbi:MAG: hypothetical protein WDN75_14495 [Bacteroidota bacterium]